MDRDPFDFGPNAPASGAATDLREYIPRVARPASCALRSGQDERKAQCTPLKCG